MAILNEDVSTSQQGFVKEIDEKGKALLMDMAQKGQYSKPLESTIRETASNAVDSMRQRDIAISILKGESVIADHFVIKEGEIYEDSVFDPTYYSLDWLSDKKEVVIEYVVRDGEERDLLRFIDCGVGLGGKVLEGFFSLSFSTKRLNKQALGKFGIGAKAPLSTGVASYKMISNYNGQRFEFDIFLRHIQSTTDKWNEAGEPNQLHVMSGSNYEYYSEATEEKNGVIIELEIKKHLKSKVREAIQNQLLYFKDIQFKVVNETWVENVPIETEIYFENQHFIVSRNNLFTKPHLVLGQPGAQINYGLIDFQELEISPRIGNVGIKVNNEDVEITPSRENIIWSPQTRDVILRKFNEASITANELVAQELNESDILKWINKSLSLNSTSGTNQILRQLSGLIDKTKLELSYPLDKSIKFVVEPLVMIGSYARLREVEFQYVYRNGAQKIQVKRTDRNRWEAFNTDQTLYYSRQSAVPRKDAYIKSLGNHRFSFLTLPLYDDVWWLNKEADITKHFSTREFRPELDLAKVLTPLEVEALVIPWSDEEKAVGVALELAALKLQYEKGLTFYNYVTQSALAHNYDLVEVPSDWTDNIAGETTTTDTTTSSVVTEYDVVDHAKRRKDAGKIFVKFPNYYATGNYHRNGMQFSWLGTEMDVTQLNDLTGDLIYTTQTETIVDPNNPALMIKDPESDEQKMQMVMGLLMGEVGLTTEPSQLDKDNNQHGNNLYNGLSLSMFPKSLISRGDSIRGTKDLIFVKVAKSLTKKLQNFTSIDRFMLDIDQDGVAFTHPKIMNWYTAKKVYEKIQGLEFLKNFSEISPYHAKEFDTLYNDARKVYFNKWGSLADYPLELKDKFVDDLEKLARFQEWIDKKNPTMEEIGEKSLEDFSMMLTNAKVIDLSLLDRAEALIEWATPVIDLLNNVNYFRVNSAQVNDLSDKEEFLNSIRHYMRDKSVVMQELSAEQQLPTTEE